MGTEVVEHDGDADSGWVEAAEVAAELEEGGAVLLGLDVTVDLVLIQVLGGHQVPDSRVASEGGAPTPAT
jgi:hypothetical protein